MKAEDEALRAARQAAEQERSAMTLKAQLDAVAKELDAKLKKEAKAAGKEVKETQGDEKGGLWEKEELFFFCFFVFFGGIILSTLPSSVSLPH